MSLSPVSLEDECEVRGAEARVELGSVERETWGIVIGGGMFEDMALEWDARKVRGRRDREGGGLYRVGAEFGSRIVVGRAGLDSVQRSETVG